MVSLSVKCLSYFPKTVHWKGELENQEFWVIFLSPSVIMLMRFKVNHISSNYIIITSTLEAKRKMCMCSKSIIFINTFSIRNQLKYDFRLFWNPTLIIFLCKLYYIKQLDPFIKQIFMEHSVHARPLEYIVVSSTTRAVGEREGQC